MSMQSLKKSLKLEQGNEALTDRRTPDGRTDGQRTLKVRRVLCHFLCGGGIKSLQRGNMHRYVKSNKQLSRITNTLVITYMTKSHFVLQELSLLISVVTLKQIFFFHDRNAKAYTSTQSEYTVYIIGSCTK